MELLSISRALTVPVCTATFVLCLAASAQDVQVNSHDNNSATLGNFTSESETYIARSGSLVVVGYNTSRQAGILGPGAFNSLSGYAYSTNGGTSFTDAGFVPAGSYQLLGDPTLVFDAAGNVYYGSLLEDTAGGGTYVAVNKSTATSPAVTFGSPVLIPGVYSANANSGAFEDKEFLAIDDTGGPYNGRIYIGWSEFQNQFDPSLNPQAMFAATSSTSPLAFSPAISLAASAPSFQHGVFPIVALDGSVYVAWSTLSSYSSAASATINLVKSTNGGATFSNPDPADPNPTRVAASFTSTAPDLGIAGQSLRTRSFPYLAIDKTPVGSPTRGNMYLVFQGRPGTAASPRSEIFFTSSTDGGITWLAPRDISSGLAATIGADTTPNDNWMPSISVSPVTGHIKILFYSRRQDAANQKIRVFEAGSTDGGMTFYNNTFSAVAFAPSDGYDSLLAPNYMGDYLFAHADSNGLVGAWGDTRDLCTPPASASAPCSPSGRGDQDVWSTTQPDATGVDLSITPWGAVTGIGPTWESPDIFVLNSANVVVNAEKGVINNLQARIRDLGNASATSAVVRFRYAPWYASIPDSAFKLIGTVTVNVPTGGATQLVPINWDLTNLTDTNGGIWPAPISTFDHFCVRVDIEYPSDINLSNNDAQTNFFDVATGTGPMTPIHFIVGNPLKIPANVQIVVDKLPDQYRGVIKAPILSLAQANIGALDRSAKRAVAIPAKRNTLRLEANELRVGTITLTRPPASVTAHLTHDLIVNVSSVVDGKTVGGFSIRLAKANTRIAKPVPGGKLKVVSQVVGGPAPPVPPVPQRFVVASPLAAAEAHKSVVAYLESRKIAIQQNVPERGLVSTVALTLTRRDLLNSVPDKLRAVLPPDTTGRYFVTFKTTGAERTDGADKSNVVVSVRLFVDSPEDIDSPLHGRLVPSNGRLENSFVSGLTDRFKIQ
jgi:hypothetical protein